MSKTNKLFLMAALLMITTLQPACKHGAQDGMELYKKYALKNLAIKNVQKNLKVKND